MLVTFSCTTMPADFPETFFSEMYVVLSSPPVDCHFSDKCDQGDCNLDFVCFFQTVS